MKRGILILFGLVLALVLFNRLEKPQQTLKTTGELPKTNAMSARLIPRQSHRSVEIAEKDSTNSASTTDEETDVPEKLSREQVEAYLIKTKRSPESLLNAFIETGDTNFLAEAVKNHSDNPLVQWTMLNQETSPEERAQWLEKLKASSPDNALPNYLSALDDFKAGKTEQALAEMDSASKKKLSSYEQERAQSREEMYLLSGFSPLEAKENTSNTLAIPDLSEIKQVAVQIGDLQKKYNAAGDNVSNEQLAVVEIEMGRKYLEPNSPYLINQLVGYAIENNALRNLDSETYFDFLGKTAGERIQEIKDQKQEIKNSAKNFPESYGALSDAEKMIYINRRMIYGELNAMRWLNQNYGGKTK